MVQVKSMNTYCIMKQSNYLSEGRKEGRNDVRNVRERKWKRNMSWQNAGKKGKVKTP